MQGDDGRQNFSMCVRWLGLDHCRLRDATAARWMMFENSPDPQSAPPMSSDRVLRGVGSQGSAGSASPQVMSFQILGLVGEGGMGVVYRAIQENPKRIVALKVIKNAARQRDIKRFKREIDILGRLQHPGISRLYS